MNSFIILKIKDIPIKRMIQKFKEIDIDIINLEIVNNYIYVKIKYNDYYKVKKYLFYYDFKIVRYSGIKNVINTIKKYNIILLFLLFSILFVIVSSCVIVDIKVVHENKDLVKLLYNELENEGIHKFSFKKKFEDLENIASSIKKRNLDKIDWLEINRVGMTYVIRVEERIITSNNEKYDYCNIYAKKNGLIKSITVYKGEKKVNINDYVKKDDLLISGDISLNDLNVSKVCAMGNVYAEVWYDVKISVPLTYEKTIYTNKKRNNLIVNYNDVDYKIFNDRLNNYESEKIKIFDLLGIKIYLEKEREIQKVVECYSEDEASQKAVKLAKEKVLLSLDKEDKIIDEKILQKRINDSKIDLDIFIVAEEKIGYTIPDKEET